MILYVRERLRENGKDTVGVCGRCAPAFPVTFSKTSQEILCSSDKTSRVWGSRFGCPGVLRLRTSLLMYILYYQGRQVLIGGDCTANRRGDGTERGFA